MDPPDDLQPPNDDLQPPDDDPPPKEDFAKQELVEEPEVPKPTPTNMLMFKQMASSSRNYVLSLKEKTIKKFKSISVNLPL